MTQNPLTQLEQAINQLKGKWPKPVAKEAVKLFEELEQSLATLKKEMGLERQTGKKSFDFVNLVSQVLKVHDVLFLNRHLSYHVVAASDLPTAYGDREEAITVLTELVGVTARHAGFGSRLEIRIQGAQLREGPVIQTKLLYQGKPLSDLERKKWVEELYASPFGHTKRMLRQAGGHFWLEFPDEQTVALTFNWPTSPLPKGESKTPFSTYKYDIYLTGLGKMRQRFGIPKTNQLVNQVEGLIRSLVRHPMDMVVAFPNQGMVTTIYESQEGAATSVATRISGRLKKEKFRIGKKSILPKFRYQLNFLT